MIIEVIHVNFYLNTAPFITIAFYDPNYVLVSYCYTGLANCRWGNYFLRNL